MEDACRSSEAEPVHWVGVWILRSTSPMIQEVEVHRRDAAAGFVRWSRDHLFQRLGNSLLEEPHRLWREAGAVVHTDVIEDGVGQSRILVEELIQR